MKNIFLGCGLLTVSLMAAAINSEIYCPNIVHCINSTCIGEGGNTEVFSNVTNFGEPIANGIAYFSNASFLAIGMRGLCQYRMGNGQGEVYLVSNINLLAANNKPNSWIGNIKYCNTNPNPPYLDNPKKCPYVGANIN